MHTNIYILGDSVAFGQYDPAGGWVQRLSGFCMENYLAGEKDEYYLINLSISGSQSQEVLSRAASEIKVRESENNKGNIIIFAVGLNDSAYVFSKKDRWVNFDTFQSNIKSLATEACKFSKTIIFLGLYPIDEAKMNPMPYDDDKSYSNESIKRYDQAIKSISQANGALYIPLYDKFSAIDHRLLLHDGAHPNSKGHELIFEIVRDYLIDKKII
jgi:lysophospholipase L1-like esterase